MSTCDPGNTGGFPWEHTQELFWLNMKLSTLLIPAQCRRTLLALEKSKSSCSTLCHWVELDEALFFKFFCKELFIKQNYAFHSMHLSEWHAFITKVLQIEWKGSSSLFLILSSKSQIKNDRKFALIFKEMYSLFYIAKSHLHGQNSTQGVQFQKLCCLFGFITPLWHFRMTQD